MVRNQGGAAVSGSGPVVPASRRSSWSRDVLLGALVVGAALGAVGLVLAHARRRGVLVPRPVDDVEILAVGPGTLTLCADSRTLAPGRYGLWLDGGRGHAQVGEIVGHDDSTGTVTRQVLGVDQGCPEPGPARWSGDFYAGTPGTLGLPYRDVVITSDVGELAAWLVAPTSSVPARGRWAVLVHGQGGTREECLRALPVLHRLGLTSLVISYRNDPLAPRGRSPRRQADGGEWQDVEAAVVHAVLHGAEEVVLVGWASGGALALKTVARSWASGRVRALVLDSPSLDWREVLAGRVRPRRPVPAGGRVGGSTSASSGAEAGVPQPGATSWLDRAAELRLPTLLVHGDSDPQGSAGPGHRLTLARPNLVTAVPFRGACPGQEWNTDPVAWDTAVARFLLSL